MTGIDVSASFGIDIAELDAYGGVDSGGGWAAFRIRKAKADPPRPARGSLGRAPRTARPNPAASVPRPGSAAPASTPLGSGSSAIPFPRA